MLIKKKCFCSLKIQHGGKIIDYVSVDKECMIPVKKMVFNV